MRIDLLERPETDPAVIPKAALAQGELLGYKKLEVYIQPLSAVVLPGRMTALELLRAAEGLWEVSRTLLEILEASEGELAPVPCLTQETDCGIECGQCPTREVWGEMWEIIKKTAGEVTVADLQSQAPSQIQI